MKIYYNPKQSVSGFEKEFPSISKPELLIKELDESEFIHFNPVTAHDLKKVHEEKFVDDTLTLKITNGFYNKSKEITESLLWTNGSMVAAAKDAFRSRGIAFSPTSGFHHAGYDYSGGYCTFNGLVLAAYELMNMGAKVGILDFDWHRGDGTEDILNRLSLTEKIVHFTSGMYYQKGQGEQFISQLSKILDQFKFCHVILYQAGADMHMDDPLGGMLTTEQMKIRDETVFDFCRDNRIGCAWNLAGGYQEPISKVLEIHKNTFEIFNTKFSNLKKLLKKKAA